MNSRGKDRLTRMRGKPFPTQRRPAGRGCSHHLFGCAGMSSQGARRVTPTVTHAHLSVQLSMARSKQGIKWPLGSCNLTLPCPFGIPGSRGNTDALCRGWATGPQPLSSAPLSPDGAQQARWSGSRGTRSSMFTLSLPCSLCEGVGSVNICKLGVRHGHHPFGS